VIGQSGLSSPARQARQRLTLSRRERTKLLLISSGRLDLLCDVIDALFGDCCATPPAARNPTRNQTETRDA
jgi:hypothetical protein